MQSSSFHRSSTVSPQNEYDNYDVRYNNNTAFANVISQVASKKRKQSKGLVIIKATWSNADIDSRRYRHHWGKQQAKDQEEEQTDVTELLQFFVANKRLYLPMQQIRSWTSSSRWRTDVSTTESRSRAVGVMYQRLCFWARNWSISPVKISTSSRNKKQLSSNERSTTNNKNTTNNHNSNNSHRKQPSNQNRSKEDGVVDTGVLYVRYQLDNWMFEMRFREDDRAEVDDYDDEGVEEQNVGIVCLPHSRATIMGRAGTVT